MANQTANSTSTSAGYDGTMTMTMNRYDDDKRISIVMWRIGSERWRMGTRTIARSSSTVSVGTPRRNPNRCVQGMSILKPIHVGILKPQIQIQTHPYPVMECSFRSKNFVMKNKKERKYCRAETQKKKLTTEKKKIVMR